MCYTMYMYMGSSIKLSLHACSWPGSKKKRLMVKVLLPWVTVGVVCMKVGMVNQEIWLQTKIFTPNKTCTKQTLKMDCILATQPTTTKQNYRYKCSNLLSLPP